MYIDGVVVGAATICPEMDEFHGFVLRSDVVSVFLRRLPPPGFYLGLSFGYAPTILLERSSRPVALAAAPPPTGATATVVAFGVKVLGTLEGVGVNVAVLPCRLQATTPTIVERSFREPPGGGGGGSGGGGMVVASRLPPLPRTAPATATAPAVAAAAAASVATATVTRRPADCRQASCAPGQC